MIGRLSFRLKLFIASVLALVVVTLALTVSQTALVRQALHAQILWQAAEQRPFMVAAFASALIEKDYAAIQAIVRESVGERGLAHLAVVDARGNVIAAHGWSPDPAASPGKPGEPIVGVDGTRRVPFEADIRIGGQMLGRVHFGLSYEPVDAAQRGLMLRSGLVALASLIFTIVLSQALHGRIMTPLVQLVRASEKIRAGEYDVDLAPVRERDVGLLTASFRLMSDEIKQRIATLTRSEETQRQLLAEALVREQALTEAKQELAVRAAQLAHSLEELQIKEAENSRLALVAQATDSAIMVTAASGAIEWVNRAFSSMTGYAFDECIGRYPGELLRGTASDARELEGIRTAHDAGQGITMELANQTKAGRAQWVEIGYTSVIGTDGKVQRGIAVLRDTTQRKQQELVLAQALERERQVTQQQRQFIATAAHEFRTPLTIIDGAAQRIVRSAGKIDPDDLLVRIEKIRAAVTRMNQLIQSTLSSASVQSGAVVVNWSRVDIVDLVRRVSARIQTTAQDFEFHVEATSGSTRVDGDPQLLDQVFSNLISNAVKFSGESRRVDLKIDLDDAIVEVTVRDYGVGIPESDQQNLFSRFHRAANTKAMQGAGLGLNLAREIVALHDGSIEVSSRLGEGTAFTVRLRATRRIGGVSLQAAASVSA